MPQEVVALPLSGKHEKATVHKTMQEVAADLARVLGGDGRLAKAIPISAPSVDAEKKEYMNESVAGLILVIDRPAQDSGPDHDQLHEVIDGQLDGVNPKPEA